MAQEPSLQRPYPPPMVMPPPTATSSRAASPSPSSSQSSGTKRRQEGTGLSTRKSTRRSSHTNTQERIHSLNERGSDTFSETTKRYVEGESGGQCLHCGAVPVEICHVVPRRDSAYDELHQQGFFAFRLHEGCNAVPLCPTCHANFDDTNNPGFVFVPVKLEYLIEYEHHDWERRRDLLLAGVKNGGVRRCPGPEEYAEQGGTYLCYTLRDFLGQYHTIRKGHVREVAWSGAPAASLRRAFGLFAHFHLMDILPANVESQLQQLFNLYRRRMSGVDEQAEPQDDRTIQSVALRDAQPELGHGQLITPAPLDDTRSPASLQRRNDATYGRTVEDAESLPSLNPTMTTFLSFSEPGDKRRGTAKPTTQYIPWSWGPRKSTAENIDSYVASLQNS